MVFVAKNMELKEFHPIRKRGVNRKPLGQKVLIPDALEHLNNPLKPQHKQWLAESWADNKELYMALVGR